MDIWDREDLLSSGKGCRRNRPTKRGDKKPEKTSPQIGTENHPLEVKSGSKNRESLLD